MRYSECVKILYQNIDEDLTIVDFSRELFSHVVSESAEAEERLSISDESFKKYYSGERSVGKFAQSIIPFIDRDRFADYLIEKYSVQASARIISEFSDHNFITCQSDFVDDTVELFADILHKAAKKSYSRDKTSDAPAEDPELERIEKYLHTMRDRFYTAKTLLYPGAPKPVNDFYVPNDLFVPESGHQKKRIPASDLLLSFKKNFVIITGTGGLGKTMLMHHLVLRMVKDYRFYKRLPVVVSLRNFDPKKNDFIAFIQKNLPIRNLIDFLKQGKCVFLLDGMDEMNYDVIKVFEKQLSEAAAKYPNNYYIMSSRPVSSFIELDKFSLYELAPFTKEQALQMIDKVVYRPDTPEIKATFRKALDEKLFVEHQDFAEIPLLLTIMLMTFEQHARIPEKRHIFYREAFDTLVNKHDSTKIGYDRAYKTGLYPADFVKLLQEFCTICYFNGKCDLTEQQFNTVFENLKCVTKFDKRITCEDLKDDLTTNLCLMYCDGGTFRYIHRNFQEYFTALRLSIGFDADFEGVWQFFEERKRTVSEDYTFDMLYDMNDERVEEFIFVPFLEDLFDRCKSDDPDDPDRPMTEYWNFLEIMYPEIFYNVDDVLYFYENEPASYIYESIVKKLLMLRSTIEKGVEYDERFEKERFLRVSNEDGEELIIEASEYDEDDDQFEFIEIAGYSCGFKTAEVRREDSAVHRAVENPKFPLFVEYQEVRRILGVMRGHLRKSNTPHWKIKF